MYYRDHAPAHFHAEYGEFEVAIEINSGVVTGHFPKRALAAVLEWYAAHKDELLLDWELASQGYPLKKIAPLE